ncbi:MAG: 4Fe-4S binding protein [Planctomycetes bacterium]|nr:4Fe-4S binding protein [Planctomycetota bacterium]
MRRVPLALLVLVILAVGIGTACAEELIPTPEFTDHEIPTATHPEPRRSDWPEILDVGVLLIALILASAAALAWRSRRGLFVLTLVSLAWFGFWREGCICSIGAIGNVALAIGDPGYVVPVGVIAFFSLPLLFALFFGRTFCAAVCPLGAIQELVAVRPVQIPRWLEHTLGLLAYVYLGAAVALAATGTALVICRYDPFVAFFRLSGSVEMLIFGAGFLLLGVFIGRPYCRFLCPYGALLGLASKVSRRHVTIPPDECIKCRMCEDACPYGAIVQPTVEYPADRRRAGRRRLALLLIALPGLIAGCAWLGGMLDVPLSRLDPIVVLADRVRAEDLGEVDGTTDASEAFHQSGVSAEELYDRAKKQRAKLPAACRWLGAWVGLVIGIKLIHLSIRRRRKDYQPDRAGCVACGRCFWYCPPEQARLGLIADLSPYIPDDSAAETIPNR